MSVSHLPPWNNLAVIAAVANELHSVYADTDYPTPHFAEVIEEALGTIAADTLERAGDQAICNKVDECTAKSIFYRAFVDWLRAVISERQERRASMHELVLLSEEMGLYHDEEAPVSTGSHAAEEET